MLLKMKRMNFMKLIRIGYWVATIIIIIVGLSFSYLIAKFDDAPGVVLIGGTMTLICGAVVFGIGEIINLLNEIKKSSNFSPQATTDDKT